MEKIIIQKTNKVKVSNDTTVKVITSENEEIMIVKNSLRHQNNLRNIKRISKKQYIDKTTGEIKTYKNNNEYKSKSAIKKEMKKLKELIEVYFKGKDTLFVTLTCKRNIEDIKVIKNYFKQFIRRLKCKYPNIAYIYKYERSINTNSWHVHLLLRYINNEEIYISNETIFKMWKVGFIKTKKVKSERKEKTNLSDNNCNIDYGSDNLFEYITKTSQLYDVPQGEIIYGKSKNLKSLETKIVEFGEIKDKLKNEYVEVGGNRFVIRNAENNKILNIHQKKIYVKFE